MLLCYMFICLWNNALQHISFCRGFCQLLSVFKLLTIIFLMQALKLLTLLGEKESTHGVLPIFNIFLSACRTNLNKVGSCVEKMENHLLGKSEITYCELLKVRVNKCSICLYMKFRSSFSYLEKKYQYTRLTCCGCNCRRHIHPWYC